MSCKAILLDRDGTIIVDQHYLSNPEGVELEHNAAAGLLQLQKLGFRLVVISNQSGIGRGLIKTQSVLDIHERMCSMLKKFGVIIDGIYFCPHTPEVGCTCRKPRPKLALQAATDLDIDLTASLVVGDRISDIGLAHAIGSKSALVRTGKGLSSEQEIRAEARQPDVIADDLLALANSITALMKTD